MENLTPKSLGNQNARAHLCWNANNNFRNVYIRFIICLILAFPLSFLQCILAHSFSLLLLICYAKFAEWQLAHCVEKMNVAGEA